MKLNRLFVLNMAFLFMPTLVFADENLFGYVKGAETLPVDASEFYQFFTYRADKGIGSYSAIDLNTEIEFGVTDHFTAGFSLKSQSIRSSDILIDAYIPKNSNGTFTLSGVELSSKYNILSPAKDDIGLSLYNTLFYGWKDSHSGQDKKTFSIEQQLILQKYFLEGELIWVGNLGVEATYAHRAEIADLPPGFEWPTEPEMEIEITTGMGLTYRLMPNFFGGGEFKYESEYETEVGQERWSTFVGPTLHYGVQRWWTTLTYFHQLEGGGPDYLGQTDARLHLIEKTKYEVRLKVGFNF